jgi:hypothetical protein
MQALLREYELSAMSRGGVDAYDLRQCTRALGESSEHSQLRRFNSVFL